MTPVDGHDASDDDATERGTFTLLYTGVFYDAQRPDTFLKALAGFLRTCPAAARHVRARFVGLFPDEGRVLAESLGLSDKIDIRGYLDHDSTIAELMNCDVAWLTIGHRSGAEGTSTGKLFEYMGSLKPILALVPPGEAASALQGYGAVQICDPDDVDAVTAAIGTWYEEWRDDRIPSGDPAHVTAFDRRTQGRRLSELLQALDR